MTFDRLIYVDRLKDAGVTEPIARAHAEALQSALQETVATKSDLRDMKADIDSRLSALDHKIELVGRDLTIKGAGGLIIIAGLMFGLKLFG